LGSANACDAAGVSKGSRLARWKTQRESQKKKGRSKTSKTARFSYGAAWQAFASPVIGGIGQGLPGGKAPNGSAPPNAPPQVSGPAAAGGNVGGGSRATIGGLVRVP